MAATKISALDAINGADVVAADLFVVVDTSDTTMGAAGTDKKLTYTQFLDIDPVWTGQHTFTRPRAITSIDDTNGNEVFEIGATASAVNQVKIANAATGGNPVISATGGDTDIGIALTPKGAGSVLFPDGDQYLRANGANIYGFKYYSANDAGRLRLYANNNEVAAINPSGFMLGDVGYLLWGTSFITSSKDVGLYRTAAGVLEVNTGTAGTLAWLMSAGHPRLVSNVTNATATMANLTELSVTLKAGRKYTFRCVLFVVDDVAADGVKIDFDGGTATMTSFRAHALIHDTALLTSAQVSAIATDITAATITGDGRIEVSGAFVVNGAGTFIPRAAQVAHTTGTLTVYLNSFLVVEEALV